MAKITIEAEEGCECNACVKLRLNRELQARITDLWNRITRVLAKESAEGEEREGK